MIRYDVSSMDSIDELMMEYGPIKSIKFPEIEEIKPEGTSKAELSSAYDIDTEFRDIPNLGFMLNAEEDDIDFSEIFAFIHSWWNLDEKYTEDDLVKYLMKACENYAYYGPDCSIASAIYNEYLKEVAPCIEITGMDIFASGIDAIDKMRKDYEHMKYKVFPELINSTCKDRKVRRRQLMIQKSKRDWL